MGVDCGLFVKEHNKYLDLDRYNVFCNEEEYLVEAGEEYTHQELKDRIEKLITYAIDQKKKTQLYWLNVVLHYIYSVDNSTETLTFFVQHDHNEGYWDLLDKHNKVTFS